MQAERPLHVIFGTGPVGMAIMDALQAHDVRIRMVNRSGTTSEPLPDDVTLVNGDASNVDFATRAAEGADVIYNALNPPYSQWLEKFPPLQAAVIDAANAAGARLVVMDNLYMYGDVDEPMTEDLPHQPHTRKGKLRAQMARDLMAAHDAGRVQVAVGRAADFIGPRVMNSAMGGDLVLERAIKGDAAQMIGNVDMPHSYTYMPDIGRALVTLAMHDDAFGEVWHLPTPPALTSREVLQKIYAEAGHRVKIQSAPTWLLWIMGLFNPDVGEVVEMVYQFKSPFVLDDSKFVARFGWEATEWETIVRETVAWFKAHADQPQSARA